MAAIVEGIHAPCLQQVILFGLGTIATATVVAAVLGVFLAGAVLLATALFYLLPISTVRE